MRPGFSTGSPLSEKAERDGPSYSYSHTRNSDSNWSTSTGLVM